MSHDNDQKDMTECQFQTHLHAVCQLVVAVLSIEFDCHNFISCEFQEVAFTKIL